MLTWKVEVSKNFREFFCKTLSDSAFSTRKLNDVVPKVDFNDFPFTQIELRWVYRRFSWKLIFIPKWNFLPHPNENKKNISAVQHIEANPDAKRLYDDLLSNYNRLIRPVVNNTETLTVWLGLKITQIIEVSLRNQVWKLKSFTAWTFLTKMWF